MKTNRTLTARLVETVLYILAWPIALGFCGCYVAASVTLDIASKLLTVWGDE